MTAASTAPADQLGADVSGCHADGRDKGEDHHEVKIGTARLKNEKRAGKPTRMADRRRMPTRSPRNSAAAGDHQRHCLQHRADCEIGT